MAVISGATVTFTDYAAPGTPRVLEIPDAAGDEITAQDIWDTLSEEAAKLDNLIYKKLINRPSSGGKNELRVGKLVDVTMQMNNLVLHFEDLAGPGYTTKEIIGGNILAVDHVDAKIDPMASSDFVNWKLVEDTAGVILEGNFTDADSSKLDNIDTNTTNTDATVNSIESKVDIVDTIVDDMQTKITLIQKILRNKLITDPVTGVMTLYDDNGDVLLTANIYEGITTGQPYRGNAMERRERLT